MLRDRVRRILGLSATNSLKWRRVEPTEQEVAVAPAPQTMEEYKDLKKEVKEKEAAFKAEPKDLDEEEAKAQENKEVDQLTDKAEAERNKNKAKLAQEEIANLERDQKL